MKVFTNKVDILDLFVHHISCLDKCLDARRDSIHNQEYAQTYLGGSADSRNHPQDDLDFAAVEDLEPTQALTLSQSSDLVEYPVRRALFNNTYSLTLFVEDNYGDVETRISYIAFKGEHTSLSREPVEVLYEKAANPKDHALMTKLTQGMAGNRHGT